MSSTTPKKPQPSGPLYSGATGRRPATNAAPSPPPPPPPRESSPSRVLSTNGIARTSSPRSSGSITRPNRASVRPRGSHSASNLGGTSVQDSDDIGNEDDARMENAALIDNLKKGLRNAEMVSEDYQQKLSITQKKLDDILKEQNKLEERLHESIEKAEILEANKREASRQVRDMAIVYESEKGAMLKDREEASTREVELKATVQRLKETMAGREMRFMNADSERRLSRQGRTHERSSSIDEGGFAPPSALQRRDSSMHRSDSKGTSRLVMQKDMVIESLRLELADAQIKLVEMENMGGDRMQDIERTLLETRMTNARLMEDNESFQLLLGERTLNGGLDFTKTDFMQGPSAPDTTSGLGSLAEELESAEGESENYRRLEAESRSLRDQNKALTLYVEKIISRVLQHDNFETILDQKPGPVPGLSTTSEKDLPPPPPAKDEVAAPSVLQRAMSVVGTRKGRPASQVFTPTSRVTNEETGRKGRPHSQIFAPAPLPHTPTAHEDPFTAPRVPLGRAQSVSNRGGSGIGHRRIKSEKSGEVGSPPGHATGTPGGNSGGNTFPATVVNQMYRGPSSGSGGPISPSSPGSTPRTNYFAPSGIVGSNTNLNRPSSGSRAVSGGSRPTPLGHTDSSASSTRSRDSGDLPSPPRNSSGNTTYTGAVMTQNKLRPLRLVQENKELENATTRRTSVLVDEDAARKRANRGSWMGWFNRGKEGEGIGTPTTPRAASTSHAPG